MSRALDAPGASASRGLVSAALARAESWLLDPAGTPPPRPLLAPRPRPVAPQPRPVVAVMGLAPRCGASAVARALAVELGARDPYRAAAVSAKALPGGLPLATPAAARLARALAGRLAERPRPVGRLCLAAGEEGEADLADATRYLAPLVLDCGCGPAPALAASLADRTVLVASPAVQPALAAVAAAAVARHGPEPVVVLNRSAGGRAWEGRAALELPESRASARLALAGRHPPGAFGAAVAELADRCGDLR